MNDPGESVKPDVHTGIPSTEGKNLTLTQQLARALARERTEEADDGTD